MSNGKFYTCFFTISVVYIKEEPEDAASHEKNEHEMKPLVGTNYSMDDIDIKEEALQDDFVSEL